MRDEAREPANPASIGVGVLVRSHPRDWRAVTAARLSRALNVNRLGQGAAGAIWPPTLHTSLEWPRGGSRASDAGDCEEVRRCSAPTKPHSSRGRYRFAQPIASTWRATATSRASDGPSTDPPIMKCCFHEGDAICQHNEATRPMRSRYR